MKDKTKLAKVAEKSFNYADDFTVLSIGEKWGILRTAKTLLKVQRETASLADASFLLLEEGKQWVV